MENTKLNSNLNKRAAKEINLKELFSVMMKRFWVIAIFAMISAVAGYIHASYFTSPLYQSSTRIIIGADEDDMKTLQVIIRDTTILEKVAKEIGMDRSPEALASQIAVQSIEGSRVVSINVVDSDPELAADIANTTAKVFKAEIPRIVDFNNVKILSKAKVNPFPINEGKTRKILIGFIFGLAAGIGLAFFLDSLDDSIKSERDIEDYLGLSVLGRISKMNKKNIKKKSNHHLDLNMRGETIVSK